MTAEEITQLLDAVRTAKTSPWMDARSAAEYASCSVEKLRLAVNAGHLKRHVGGTPGKLVRFHRDDLDRWLRGKK